MINGKTVLGVIPARKDSKRFPGKNRSLFRGKPLFQWTVEEALKSEYLDQITLTTDDPLLLEMSHEFPINRIGRPVNLSTDEASTEDVLKWVLTIHSFDIVVLLQPTSPLRTVEDIDTCISMFHVKPVVSYGENGRNGAVYVCSSQTIDFTDNIPYLMPQERSLDVDYKEDVGL